MKWICVQDCVWGTQPKFRQGFDVGDVVDHPERPCKHFKSEEELYGNKKKKIEAHLEVEDKTTDEITKDELKLMTKKQINDKFDLGLSKNKLQFTSKENVITMAQVKNEGLRAVKAK